MRDAVITVVAGRHDRLTSQCAALAALAEPPGLHVVVAMNDPGVAGLLPIAGSVPTRLVRLDADLERLPLAAARNAGAEAAIAAGADLLVFLDVDCLPGVGLLSGYRDAAGTDRGDPALLCGPVTYLPKEPALGWQPDALAKARAPHPARPDPEIGELINGRTELFWSLSFAVTTAAWNRIGGFDEGYTGYGAEDTDFAQRAAAVGVPVVWVGGADAYHRLHDTLSPPAQHLPDLLRNGRRYAEHWGAWPMSGWLQQLAEAGLVDRSGHDWVPREPLRLLTVPARHPYVQAVAPSSVVSVLTDRVQGWEPDPIFDPRYLATVSDTLDLIHLHFGYEHLTETEMSDWLELIEQHRIPLVVTVHDLRNPHDARPEHHQRHLQLLLRRATAVLTLTPGAATAIERRYGRTATVTPHPGLLDVSPAAGPARGTELGLVTLHLKSLRANTADPEPLVAAVEAGVRQGGGRLRVDVHSEVRHDPRLAFLTKADAGGRLELVVHDRFEDDELTQYLSRAHVSVLPYRFGTHSGWLELCRDLGTRVVAPTCGFYNQQWDSVIPYANDERRGLEAESLTAAVATALHEPPPAPAHPADRIAERALIKGRHALLYASLAARRTPVR